MLVVIWFQATFSLKRQQQLYVHMYGELSDWTEGTGFDSNRVHIIPFHSHIQTGNQILTSLLTEIKQPQLETNNYLHLVPRHRMHGAPPPGSYMPSWCGVVWHMVAIMHLHLWRLETACSFEMLEIIYQTTRDLKPQISLAFWPSKLKFFHQNEDFPKLMLQQMSHVSITLNDWTSSG
jgi:hypothetical protein